MTDADKVFKIVKAFVEKHGISCPEAIGQNDRVIEDAYNFIEDLCNVVGYIEYDED